MIRWSAFQRDGAWAVRLKDVPWQPGTASALDAARDAVHVVLLRQRKRTEARGDVCVLRVSAGEDVPIGPDWIERQLSPILRVGFGGGATHIVRLDDHRGAPKYTQIRDARNVLLAQCAALRQQGFEAVLEQLYEGQGWLEVRR